MLRCVVIRAVGEKHWFHMFMAAVIFSAEGGSLRCNLRELRHHWIRMVVSVTKTRGILAQAPVP